MNISTSQQTTPGAVSHTPSRFWLFVMRFMLPVTALACGVTITVYLLNTKPQARPAKRASTATLVEVQTLSSGTHMTLINGMGAIIPAREIEMKPQVSGEITRISQEFQRGAKRCRSTVGFFLLDLQRCNP